MVAALAGCDGSSNGPASRGGPSHPWRCDMASRRPILTEAQREQRRAQQRELVIASIEQLRSSDGWRAYLTARARFRSYTLVILSGGCRCRLLIGRSHRRHVVYEGSPRWSARRRAEIRRFSLGRARQLQRVPARMDSSASCRQEVPQPEVFVQLVNGWPGQPRPTADHPLGTGRRRGRDAGAPGWFAPRAAAAWTTSLVARLARGAV